MAKESAGDNIRKNKDLILWGVGGFLAWQYVAKPILEFLHLKETKEHAEFTDELQEQSAAGIWSKNWIDTRPQNLPARFNTLILAKYSTTLQWAKNIYEAIDWWKINDDEEKIYSVFREMKYKSNVSQTAARFSELYKKDLLEFLNYYLNDEFHYLKDQTEMAKVLEIVKNLPFGFKDNKTGEII